MICLTPVLNESWILDAFLHSTVAWADRVILADQGSTDDSREIAERFEKAMVIDNPSPIYDEGARQKLLLKEARRIRGRRLLMALDADELLSCNWRSSLEWKRILSAPPGTVIWAKRVNLCPGLRECWIEPELLPVGLVDDGAEHTGSPIHSIRLPVVGNQPSLRLDEVVLLHLQYLDWERMKAKQRWYQCWELLHSSRRPIQLFRAYHHMEAVPPEAIRPVQAEWLRGQQDDGADPRSLGRDVSRQWDREVLGMLDLHGARHFRRLDIWDVDWVRFARQQGVDTPERFQDPRGSLARSLHHWLRRTQRRALDPRVRLAQRLLIPFRW